MRNLYLISSLLILFCSSPSPCPRSYPWLKRYDSLQTIAKRIPLPKGYIRVPLKCGSFGDWLRHLPLKKGRPPVYLYDGEKKINQDAHFAVIDMDVGEEDLQQCADAVIRLRAEYFYSKGEYDSIHFNLTSGDNVPFRKWIEGYRPRIRGSRVRWVKSAKPDSSYTTFRKYLNLVFKYAGTFSLSKELHRVKDINEMRIGDVFIQGGFPGHSIIVVDMAVNKKTGKKLFLLAQSYMPAQDVHILRNPENPELNPWYEIDFGDILYTPEWVFEKDDLKRF